MYTIRLTNFDYFLDVTFDHLDRAFQHGRSKGFDFQVYQGRKLVGWWTVFGGTRLVPLD